MIARDLILALLPVLALAGCAGLKRWVASEPRPGCAVYVGGLDMPDRPDIADRRRERVTRRATAGGIAAHTYLEFSGRMAAGGETTVHAVAGYLTWF